VILNEQQLNRIIEALNKSFTDRKDQYLINYLEQVKKSQKPFSAIELDQIPF
jgi:endonuclease V-like protein UPF0215 family